MGAPAMFQFFAVLGVSSGKVFDFVMFHEVAEHDR
jgi:hypothetical protein